MGDKIFSTLSAVPLSRETKPMNQPKQSQPPQTVCDHTHTVSFVEDVAVDVITVTDYAEVELGTSMDSEVVMIENSSEGRDPSTVTEDCLVVLPNELTSEGEEVIIEAREEESQEKATSGSISIVLAEDNQADLTSSQQKISLGPHDCPDCNKKFKFASSLIAHRVIHTGERPHRCSDCGRCFSFRQSLDRHRQTHKTARKYDCVVCGEIFRSLSARTEHKQTHMDDGIFTCHQCHRKFNLEMALARHLKTHAADHSASEPSESLKDDEEVVGDESVTEAAITLAKPGGQVLLDDVEADPDNAEEEGSERLISEPKGASPEVDNNLVSMVKVRTSGRKRKPTMKIQVINLQKCMAAKRQKKINKGSSPKLKPLPLNW